MSSKTKFTKEKLEDAFKDINVVKQALADCIIEGDFEGFQDVLAAFVDSLNKLNFSKEHLVSRNTLYRIRAKENITIRKAFEILESAEKLCA